MTGLSDQQWISDIPEHWEVKRLRHLSDLELGLTYSPSDVKPDDTGIRVLRASNVFGGKLVSADDVYVDLDVPDALRLKQGDVLICSRSGSRDLIGKNAVVTPEFEGDTFGAFMTVLRSEQSRYLQHVLSSNIFFHQTHSSMTSTINQLTLGMLKGIVVPCPPAVEQERIADFLDERTARIDSLIEKKRRLLELLVEKRQVLITQAVTKGLDSSAPMKDSGIDWLGLVPAHWKVVPFKWRCSVQSGQVDPTDPRFSQMVLIAPDHIESGSGRLLEEVTAEEQGAISGKYYCPSGAVLYSKIRPALRKATLYNEPCLCSADMYAIVAGPSVLRDFLYFYLLGEGFSSYAEMSSMRVAMPKVNREALGTANLPVPSIDEQRSIIDWIKKRITRIEELSLNIEASIDRLKEYRSALITAVVTRQLDLDGEAA